MVTKIFQLLLLLSPIATGTNVAPEMFDMIFFRCGVIALFMASLIDTPKREMSKDIKLIVLGLLGLCFMNIFIHTFAPTVMMATMNLFLGIVGFYIVYTYWNEKQNLTKYILWVGLINLLFFISQRLGFDPVFNIKPYAGEEGALLGNKQRLMTYFALVTPFLWTPLLIISMILGIYTKQLVIFIPTALCLWQKIKNKREHLGFWIAVILAIILFSNKIISSLSYRFNLAWKPALELFFDRPLIGYGLGVRPIPDLEVLGNSYLQFIMGMGILGAVWFGWVFKKLWKVIITDVSIISLALIMCIEYPIEIPRLWFLIIATIIMFLIKQKEGLSHVSN